MQRKERRMNEHRIMGNTESMEVLREREREREKDGEEHTTEKNQTALSDPNRRDQESGGDSSRHSQT
jgi:phosphatidate phosphatase PAH1